MEKVDTLVIDKTGTLTEGKPAVTAIVPAGGFREADVLRLAASVERASEHPLAVAIVRAADERGISTAIVTDFDSPTGKGALGQVDGKRVALGNAKFLAELGVDTTNLANQAEALRQDGATAIFMAIDGKLAGVLAIADPVKPTTAEALNSLKSDGMRVVMKNTAAKGGRRPGDPFRLSTLRHARFSLPLVGRVRERRRQPSERGWGSSLRHISVRFTPPGSRSLSLRAIHPPHKGEG